MKQARNLSANFDRKSFFRNAAHHPSFPATRVRNLYWVTQNQAT